ncbi:acetyl-coenzyme A synthetase 2-like, mitochondrial isoform X5 [Prinia subflava]
MSVSPVSVAAMLACARIGAVHTVIFAGFSAESLAGRIVDSGCKAVITYNQGVRGGRTIELKATVDEAVKNCPSIKHVFVAQRTDKKVQMGDRDIPLEEEMTKADCTCIPESMDSEDTLFMLYTSGSTGKPKGVVHTQAGYLLYAALTHKYVFDYQQGDVFGCVADIGWITGHSYVVYGPLCNGATSVLFESTPVYPDPGRYWEVVQRLKINQFYGAPTAIRLLLNYGEEWVKKYDRSSLKVLGSVGEPINKEAWQWFHQVVGEGRCALVDTWWQTETGGICIAPRPSEEEAEIVPAMAMRPFFGIVPVLMDEKGEVLEGNDVSGALCIAQPWPGMARTIHGDHQRFIDAYFKAYPGYYFTGDGAYRSQQGYYQITGRVDDIINVSGHRLGTAEIEDAMADHPEVPETAVVGYPHQIKGEGAFAFIVLKEQTACADHIKEELRTIVASKIAKYAVPEHILVPSAAALWTQRGAAALPPARPRGAPGWKLVLSARVRSLPGSSCSIPRSRPCPCDGRAARGTRQQENTERCVFNGSRPRLPVRRLGPARAALREPSGAAGARGAAPSAVRPCRAVPKSGI